MLARLRARLTYANVISTICLFLVVSGGTAVALDGTDTVFTDDIVNGEVRNADIGANEVTATRLAANSVETSEIRDGRVFNADLAGNSITSSRIADGTLTTADLGTDSVASDEIANAAVRSDEVLNNNLTHSDIADLLRDEATITDTSDDGNAVTTDLDFIGIGTELLDINGSCDRSGANLIGAVTVTGTPAGWNVDSNAPGGVNNQTNVPSGTPMAVISVSSSVARQYQTGDFGAMHGANRIHGQVSVEVDPPSGQCSITYTRSGDD